MNEELAKRFRCRCSAKLWQQSLSSVRKYFTGVNEISMSDQAPPIRHIGKVLALVVGLLSSIPTQAQYVVTEGKGYVLCERVAAHVNRLTENGSAKRLWRIYGRGLEVIPYPQKQSYLTRELRSFPGFKRPAFSEIKLEDIRRLIELMGEVDASGLELRTPYYHGSSGIERYIADRKAGTVPAEVLDKLMQKGQRFYRDLEQGKARVFRLTGDDSPVSPGTLLQIEYADYKGEPISLLRYVSDDLNQPQPRETSLDSPFPSMHLVMWNGGYYTVYESFGSFEVESRTAGRNPRLCRVDNRYRPPEAP